MSSILNGSLGLSDGSSRSLIAPGVPTIHGPDVLAIWQKIFDAAKPVSAAGATLDSAHEAAAGGSQRSSPSDASSLAESSGSSLAQSAQTRGSVPRAMTLAGDPRSSALQIKGSPRPFLASAGRMTGPVELSRGAAAGSDAGVASHLPSVLDGSCATAAVPASPQPPPSTNEASDAAPDGIERSPTTCPEAESAPSEESVLVFRDEQQIDIVVRNVALPADLAIRCALETARELIGTDRALRRVTLNGYTVYAASHPLQTEGQRSAPDSKPALVFAC